MKRILILDAQLESQKRTMQILSSDQYVIQVAENRDAALRRLRAWKPHVFIFGLDPVDKNKEWKDLITKIRSIPADEYSTVLLLCEGLSLEDLAEGVELGVDSVLQRSFQPKELIVGVLALLKQKEVRDALRRANHRIEELISVDDLTGLLSMRAAYRRGDEEIMRSHRLGKPVSALMFNIDGFSGVNQSYGFMVGSQILQEVARRVKSVVRTTDLVARVGADEFFILFPDTSIEEAQKVVEVIRSSILSTPFKSDRYSIRLTCTCGVAGITEDQTQKKMNDLLHIASEALRSAKGEGPNRVQTYSLN